MIKAWKLPDGRYRLDLPDEGFWPLRELVRRVLLASGVVQSGSWVVPEGAVDAIKAEKVYGVVAGPSSCGCEPAMFRWVTASEVKAGKTDAKSTCPTCAQWKNHDPSFVVPPYHCDIIDVCGEADVAEQVYQAEFRDKLAPTR